MEVIPLTNWRTLRTEIPEDLWVQELDKKGALTSPLFNGEADREAAARLIYRWIVDNGECAELMLAIAGREHTWGTNPNSVLHRNDTRSFTNARSLRKPGVGGHLIMDSVRSSHYVKYDNAMGSVQDGYYRIRETGYAYRNTTTLFDLFSIWAPSEDQNNPEAYAWWVANYIEGIRSRETAQVPGGDSPLVPWVPADSRHFTVGRAGVTWPDLIIGHHSDGWDSLPWLTTSPNSNVSATYLFNHDGSIRAQLVRHADTPHTTGYMNPRSLSFEWERRWTGTTEQRDISDAQYERIGKSVAHMVRVERARGNPNFVIFEPHRLGDHNDYFSTICPGNLSMARVFEVANRELNVQPSNDLHRRYFSETGKWVVLGFKALWEQAELLDSTLIYRLVGLPITNEGDGTLLDGTVVRCQFFERCVFKYIPGQSSPWDLVAMQRNEVEQIAAFDESTNEATA